MRVVQITDRFPQLSETFIAAQMAGILSLGAEVSIAAAEHGADERMHPIVDEYRLLDKLIPIPPRSASKSLCRQQTLMGLLKGLACSPLRTSRLFWGLLQLPGGFNHHYFHRLQNWPKRPFEIAHCHYGTNAIFGIAAKQTGHARHVITEFHGADISQHLKVDADRYRNLYPLIDHILVVCNYFKNLLVQDGCPPEKITCHHTGINTEQFAFQPASSKPTNLVRILSVGRLVEKKGFDIALEALAQIRKKHPNLAIAYTIVGDGPLAESLHLKVKDLNLGDIVEFKGAQTQETIQKLLGQNQIMLQPSRTAANGDKEGIPVVLEEAMACGLPVVSTFHSGIPELVEDGVSGVLAPEGDVDALARALGELIAAPESWLRLAENARRKIEQEFDIRPLSKRLMQIYQEVLDGD